MENYKEKYECALETIQEILNSDSDLIMMSRLKLRLQSVFPELKESEDEKTRKDIISYIQLANQFIPQFQKDRWIAWLEKQKPTEWSDEEKRMLNGVIGSLEVLQDVSPERMPIVDKEIQWLKSLKNGVQPQTKEWSEEDEKMFDFCCDYLDDNQINWLKSLKDRMKGKEE